MELASHFLFFLLAFLLVAAALNLVFNPHPVYGALGMAGGFFSLSVIYLLINQPFYAAIQLLVYAGAIMVLFLFIIMLLNLKKEASTQVFKKSTIFAGIVGTAFFAKIASVVFGIFPKAPLENNDLVEQMQNPNSLAFIGELLFGKYLLPFEFISFILLIAVVGCVLISKKHFPSKRS